MIEQVRQWLADKGPYGIGVALLMGTGKDVKRFQKYIKAPAVPDYWYGKVVALLTEWLHKQPSTTPHATSSPLLPATHTRGTATATVTLSQTAPTFRPPANEPAEVKALRDKAGHYLRRQTQLREIMRQAKTDEERYQLAHEMMAELVPKVDQIYDRIRRWEKTGTLPPEVMVADTPEDGVKLMRNLQTARSSLSRMKKQLKDGKFDTMKKKQEAEVFIAKKEAEIAELMEKLGKQ